jgi:hypothetical protein
MLARRQLRVPGGLAGEVGEVASNGRVAGEAQGFLSLVSPNRRLPVPSTAG